MAGESREEPLLLAEPYPLSSMSPVASTFRFLERDFKGAVVPLFACAVVGSLETLLLLVGFVQQLWLGIVVVAAWLPISSYASASMLTFALRVARGEPYSPRDVWAYRRTSVQLGLLKLVSYGLAGAWFYGLFLLMERVRSQPVIVGVLLVVVNMVLVSAAFARLCLAPVVAADRGAWPLAALAGSLQLTRGNTTTIVIYGVILSMIAGVSQAICGLSVLATLATPGLVYLYRALRGEPAD